MYITYLNSTHAQPLRALVHCISSKTDFMVNTVRSLVQHPFPLRDRRNARRCPFGGWMRVGGIAWHAHVDVAIKVPCAAQCIALARTAPRKGNAQCSAVPLARHRSPQVPRKHPFIQRGVHSVRHSVPPNGGNKIGNGSIRSQWPAQC